jgi:hypothetical protein
VSGMRAGKAKTCLHKKSKYSAQYRPRPTSHSNARFVLSSHPAQRPALCPPVSAVPDMARTA